MPAPKGNQYAKGNKGGGAKSTYDPKYAAIAEKACLIGYTDKELADLFKVSEATINNWKLEHEEFASALKIAKAHADDRVEQSLYRRALGYSHDAVKIFKPAGEPATKVPYVEHHAPDTVACIFWLKNRRPDVWRDVKQVNVTRELPQEQRDKLIASIVERAAKTKPNGAAH